MEPRKAKQIVEGLLLVSHEPLPLKRLLEALPELDGRSLRHAIEELNVEYRGSERGFHIQEVAGGYQLVTNVELAPWMKRMLQAPREGVLSKAAMETLAIVAYRQPITKVEIETVRGVDGTATLETLLERQFVRIVGRKETPGRPLLYGTTTEFLRHFGLGSLEALPPMKDAASPLPSFDQSMVSPLS